MSSLSKDNGGPAFPAPVDVKTDFSLRDVTSGMTLRDWFAGQALAGILGSGDFLSPEGLFMENGAGAMSQAAYLLADAMLAERSK